MRLIKSIEIMLWYVIVASCYYVHSASVYEHISILYTCINLLVYASCFIIDRLSYDKFYVCLCLSYLTMFSIIYIMFHAQVVIFFLLCLT